MKKIYVFGIIIAFAFVALIGKKTYAAVLPYLPHKAEAYIVYDFTTGETILSKDAEKARPIASITKLMTALVALETLSKDTVITISPTAHETLGEWASLMKGDRFTRDQALRPLLLSSDNDIAVAFTEVPLIPSFISRMNTKAHEIGMTSTVFVEGSGLNAKNVSSPNDLAKLLSYIDVHYPELMDITREKSYSTISLNGNPYTFTHNHRTVNEADRIGGKSGLITASGRTLASLYDLSDGKENHRIAIVTLKSTTDDWGEDSSSLKKVALTSIQERRQRFDELYRQYFALLDLAKQRGLIK